MLRTSAICLFAAALMLGFLLIPSERVSGDPGDSPLFAQSLENSKVELTGNSIQVGVKSNAQSDEPLCPTFELWPTCQEGIPTVCATLMCITCKPICENPTFQVQVIEPGGQVISVGSQGLKPYGQVGVQQGP